MSGWPLHGPVHRGAARYETGPAPAGVGPTGRIRFREPAVSIGAEDGFLRLALHQCPSPKAGGAGVIMPLHRVHRYRVRPGPVDQLPSAILRTIRRLDDGQPVGRSDEFRGGFRQTARRTLRHWKGTSHQPARANYRAKPRLNALNSALSPTVTRPSAAPEPPVESRRAATGPAPLSQARPVGS